MNLFKSRRCLNIHNIKNYQMLAEGKLMTQLKQHKHP